MNVMFLPTLNAGVTYWRMFNFWVASYRKNAFGCNTLYWDKGLTEHQPWQNALGIPAQKHQVLNYINMCARTADIIVMQLPITYEALHVFESLLDAFPDTPCLIETDDNILSTPEYNPASSGYAPGSSYREVAVKAIKMADGIIASTPYLAEVYSEFNDNIHVINNCIDFEKWDYVKRKKKPGVTLGWAGGASHNEDLAQIEKVMKKILRKYKDVKLIMAHGIPKSFREMKGVICVDKFVRIDKYPKHLGSLGPDIWLAPLVDNAFNRGKSTLRWLEGSALGIPTVASNVGHFKETIIHGKDGFLANDPKEFGLLVEQLILDKKLRKKMGREANARIRRDFNVDNVVMKYRDILQGFIDRGTGRVSPEVAQEKILIGEVIHESA